MRFARIIDKEDEMETLANVTGLTNFLNENERRNALLKYQNLIQQKWRISEDFKRCYVLMVCLDDEISEGFQLHDMSVTGFYEKEVDIATTGKIKISSAYLGGFPQFRRNRYASFLLEHMIAFLTLMKIEDLKFYPTCMEIEDASSNRGYKGPSGGCWSKV